MQILKNFKTDVLFDAVETVHSEDVTAQRKTQRLSVFTTKIEEVN